MGLLFFLIFLLITSALVYHRTSLNVLTACYLLYLIALSIFSGFSILTIIIVWLLFTAILLPLNIPILRIKLLSAPLFNYAAKQLPTLSRTEQEALDAGTVNWDGQIFSGKPDWNYFLSLSAPKISKDEQAFLDKQVTELCTRIEPWDMIHNKYDISKEVIDYVKQEKFMSFIIPKKYGGLDFSFCAQSEALIQIGSRSSDIAIALVGVPNSLGPAELLLKYGTKEQKDYYLPRLATGEEIPCFALTGPFAGSDAGGLPDYGIVEKGTFEGKEIIGIRLTFDKRYITLAPIATLIGLAFKLYDPNHLIGNSDSYGITCALIPRNTKGISIGRRHYPLHQAFPNGPIRGKDVFIPLDWIIGGSDMAGKGWKMLVECLSVGRAVSLPTGAVTAAKMAAYSSALYSKTRRAFRVPIANFEGIQEKLTECACFTLIADSTRLFTLAAIDRGEKPSVPSAISKYHATELSRKVILNAMDIHGGKGIMLGPKNYLAHAYEGSPVAITVEGANILTRNMIIFGQGGIRCHPYILNEIQALKNADLKAFDKSIISHIGFSLSNLARSKLLGLTDGLIVRTPAKVNKTKRYYQKVTRLSAAFSAVADISMIVLGGKLKFKESISARLGDALSMLFMATAVLKKFEDDGQPKDMLPLVEWSSQYLIFETQKALDNTLRNFPNKIISCLLRVIIFPLGRRYKEPNDKLGQLVAKMFLDSETVQMNISKGLYLDNSDGNLLAKLKNTVLLLEETSHIESKVIQAKREGKINGHYFDQTIKEARQAGIINTEEERQLLEAFHAMAEVISVDDFDLSELSRK